MSTKVWKIITIIELVAAVIVVLLDLFVPTLVILGMALISLIVRREKPAILGLKKSKSWLGMAAIAFLGAVLLQLFDAGVMMPILNRLTGTAIDNSGVAQLQGNLQQLLIYLVLAWTLAALGEEIVYRGYLQKLLGDLFGSSLAGVILTIGISSMVFGLAHLEQGIVGVIVTTFDGVFYSLLKRKFKGNLWAAILAHGFYNTVGMVVFYFAGPINGLW